MRHWSICRSGVMPEILDKIEQDVRKLETDLGPEDRHVPAAILEYVRHALETMGPFQRCRVKVAAFANDLPRGRESYDLDIHIDRLD